MTAALLIASMLALGLLGYLAFSLLKPEAFQ